jgi:hypothetical protein
MKIVNKTSDILRQLCGCTVTYEDAGLDYGYIKTGSESSPIKLPHPLEINNFQHFARRLTETKFVNISTQCYIRCLQVGIVVVAMFSGSHITTV